jgi:hypothetical protein
VKYDDITKGFISLLKQWAPFIWDEFTQQSFETLKKALMSTPILSPLNYSRYFLLSIMTLKTTVGIVLVKEDDISQEHIIYYLSCGLIGLELNYSHVEKLALAIFHVVHRL